MVSGRGVIGLRAVVPDQAAIGVTGIEREIAQQLESVGFGGAMVNVMARYPAQLATASGYRRTGTLGRNWMLIIVRRGQVLVVNRTQYAIWVQGRRRGSGPRQTKEMRRRNWLAIDDGVRQTWPRFRRNIVLILQQRTPSRAAARRRQQ